MDSIELVDLASERLGGAVVYANDDFFASKDNLLKPSAPVFIADKYTDRGKWMDGWESRRSRTPGFDWCIVRLGLPGRVRRLVVDTSFFRGNYPEQCSMDLCELDRIASVEELTSQAVQWRELLPVSALNGDSENEFELESTDRATHLRFRIYPDGGVARLRVLGEVVPDRKSLMVPELDLASVENGARIIDCSDRFFGNPLNMIMPGRAANMGDGWETKRRRGPGNDWTIVKLAGRSEIRSVEIDTSHFKGNYPDRFVLESANITEDNVDVKSADWLTVIPSSKLQAHARHLFDDQIEFRGPATHIRLSIFPDGGISRLRIFGKLVDGLR